MHSMFGSSLGVKCDCDWGSATDPTKGAYSGGEGEGEKVKEGKGGAEERSREGEGRKVVTGSPRPALDAWSCMVQTFVTGWAVFAFVKLLSRV